MNKVIVILGPTATGKSDLAVEIAKKYNGEVISADSRQVYKGLDIGTGKITKKEMRGVPHYLLDMVSPKKTFTVSDWKKAAEKAMKDITSRGKLPIICGGTGFYIDSVVSGIVLPEVAPNTELRKKLEKKTVIELHSMLKKIDPERAENIDSKNPVRLIRAIEIAKALGKVPALTKDTSNTAYSFLQIGLTLPENELKEKIKIRLKSRLKKGMIAEAENLHKAGLSFKRMRELGLEYRYLADLISEKIDRKEFEMKLTTEIWQYVKRQITWFKRDKNIEWFSPLQKAQIEKTVQKFLD